MDALNEFEMFLFIRLFEAEQLALNSALHTLLLGFREADELSKRMCWSSLAYITSLWRKVF